MIDSELVDCPRCAEYPVTVGCFLCAIGDPDLGPFKIPAALAVEYTLVNAQGDLHPWVAGNFTYGQQKDFEQLRKRHGYGE